MGQQPPQFIPDDEDNNPQFIPDEEEQPGFASRAWHMLSDPLTDLPSRVMNKVADWEDSPKEDAWRIPLTGGMTWRGLGAGIDKGAGDLITGFTSPLNIAATIGTGGSNLAMRAGLPTVAKAVSGVGRAASGLMAAHGGMQVLDPETSWGEKGFGLAELAGGLAGTQHTVKGKGVPTPKAEPFIPSEIPADTPNAPTGKLKDVSKMVLKGPNAMNEVARLTNEGFIASGLDEKGNIVMTKPTPKTAETVAPKSDNLATAKAKYDAEAARLKAEFLAKAAEIRANKPARTPKFTQSVPQAEGRTLGEQKAVMDAADPNMNQGIGDPEMAGTEPYQPASPIDTPPEGENPLFAEHYARQRRLNQNRTGSVVEPENSGVSAEHAFDWPDFHPDGSSEPMYHIKGGEFDKSTVGAQRLRELGIEIPETATQMGPDNFDPNTGELFEEPIPRMPTPDSLNPEFDARRQAMIDDTARMERDRRNAPRNIERETFNENWNRRQQNSALREGRNINDARTPLTREQQLIRDSYKRIEAEKNKYSEWFAEQEALLPENEFFQPDPAVKEAHQAKIDAMDDAHDALVQKLTGGFDKAPPPDIDVMPSGSIAPIEPSFFDRMGPNNFSDDVLGSTFGDDIFGPEKSNDAPPQRRPGEINTIKPEIPEGQLTNADMIRLHEERFGPNNSDFSEQVLPHEFSQDIFARNEPVPELGGESPVFEERVPTETPAPKKGILDRFFADESGEYRGPLDRGNAEVTIENPTLDKLKEAIAAGYEFAGSTSDTGGFKMVKKGSGGGKPPILETDIGNTSGRPPRGPLGPKTDLAKSNPYVEAYNFPRALKASMDFSAPLRQGFALIHKKEFWKSLKPMWESWVSEEGFRQSQDAISERPLFRERKGVDGKVVQSFAEQAGLKLTDLTDLTKREEVLMSTWAEKIPGVRKSNRAYTAFLNNLRADTFESLVRDSGVFQPEVKANVPMARALAEFVNTATGRGSLDFTAKIGKHQVGVNLEQAAGTLGATLFAPRLIASRLRMLDPRMYLMGNPVVRKEALKSLLAMAAVGNSIGGLAKMAGADVSMDPTSTDFGKIKIGNTRLDPWAGFQQYGVAAARLLSGRVASSTSDNVYDLDNPDGPYDPSRKDILERFGRGKLHPVIGFAWSLLDGAKDVTGKPLDFTSMSMDNTIVDQFIPLIVKDVYDLAQSDPKLLPLAIPAALGMGIQTYDGQ